MNWELLGVFLLLVLVVIPVIAGGFVLLLRTFRTEDRRRRRAREYAGRSGWAFAPSQPELRAEYFGIPPFTSGTRPQFDDVIHHTDGRYQGGFNRLSQHLDEKGGWQWLPRTGVRRPVICPRGCVGSGVRIGHCVPRCVPQDVRPLRGRCSVSSGR